MAIVAVVVPLQFAVVVVAVAVRVPAVAAVLLAVVDTVLGENVIALPIKTSKYNNPPQSAVPALAVEPLLVALVVAAVGLVATLVVARREP